MRICALAIIALLLNSAASSAAEEIPTKVTFTEHIAPIVFNQCASCHRPGQVAPFSLLNYTDTRKHAKTMLRVIKDRFMPPWQPEPGYGEFREERRLTETQILLFEKWVETDMAEGDSKQMPALPKFPEGWQLGKPDLIVKMDRPFDVPAAGADIYRNFVIPLGLDEDKWVTAVDFRASAPEVMHHVLYLLDEAGVARTKIKKDGQPGFSGTGFSPTGSLGGWAVGASPIRLPEGFAYHLRKKSDLVLQTHFHLLGKAAKEEITIAIYFADKPPKRSLVKLELPPGFGIFANVDIPPGQSEVKLSDSFTLPVDVDILEASSHAHYLGKTMRTIAKLPDGSEKKLFSIRDWNFNWQGHYIYKELVRLPKGTTIHGEVTWDNSAANPRNPTTPPVRVRWGESSTDEMGQVSLLMVAADEADKDKLREALYKHAVEAARKSRWRGDNIDWDKLGLEPPAFWKDAPVDPDKKEATSQSRIFRDLDGRDFKPLCVDKMKAHVLLFITTDCPIANSYVPEINALVKQFADAPIRFFAIQVDSELTPDAARKHAKEYGISIPVLLDVKHDLVSATGVTHTPEVAVLLPDGTIAYRGRIDDRYPSLGKKRPVAGQRDLRDAISAILAGEKVPVARTEAVGCSIPDLPASAKDH